MIDISKESVKIEYPNCKHSISVSLKQVAKEVVLIVFVDKIYN